MKNKTNTKNGAERSETITLRDYYLSLPKAKVIAPRKEFLESIAKKCEVTISTARNWVMYGMKPQKQSHVEVISRETGLPADRLFNHN